jgi:hypothetical protein
MPFFVVQRKEIQPEETKHKDSASNDDKRIWQIDDRYYKPWDYSEEAVG